ncbi:hypothetical protein ACFFLM_25860 [Deinococcus oregonensis]|uniref:Uncharacterized protein n=1 Tax=Deinococcus oregonensis TaxID=1805970 RepID=A0ABV6B6I1_9DEIO
MTLTPEQNLRLFRLLLLRIPIALALGAGGLFLMLGRSSNEVPLVIAGGLLFLLGQAIPYWTIFSIKNKPKPGWIALAVMFTLLLSGYLTYNAYQNAVLFTPPLQAP